VEHIVEIAKGFYLVDRTHLPPVAATDDPLALDDSRSIPRTEITVQVSRSGGAGGQHVNKTSTKVALVWCPGSSAVLTEEEKARIAKVLAPRLDANGCLHVVSSESRSQLQNRAKAEARLAFITRRAMIPPKVRRVTKPTRASKEARLEHKKRVSRRKSERRRDAWE
jgi:ribosome-associated protein